MSPCDTPVRMSVVTEFVLFNITHCFQLFNCAQWWCANKTRIAKRISIADILASFVMDG